MGLSRNGLRGRASVLASPNMPGNQGSRGRWLAEGWPALSAAVLLLGATATASDGANGGFGPVAPVFESEPVKVAKMLAAADAWLLPQPKAVAMSGEAFDLKKCKGIRLLGCDDPRLKIDFPALLQERCGIRDQGAPRSAL